ncbi:MAG: LexA family transcriptional regulator [Muribaculaceae bacterium]|nr:LexA family transcriptional regulator [Muribaculaceae bacterium]
MRERISRFIKYMEFKGLNDNQVTIQCNLSRGLLGQARTGKSDLGEKAVDKILKEYQDLNKIWLLTGEGEMLNETGGFVEVPDSEVLNLNPKPGDNVIMVPLINIDSVGSMERTNSMTWREQYVVRDIPFIDARPDDVAIYQSGDSMTPGIPSGSILHIRQVQDWQEYFGYGDTFVLWLKDDRRITKQVLKYREDPKNYVVCHSFNPVYEDEELPKKFIRQVWKVITILSDKGW